jgi:7,8-dihydropterin-6-yl-methyl-4-(beta-D-ribofuranosyl)aminobenzene 5'-phosphate synthase
MDNHYDALLASTEFARRMSTKTGLISELQPRAEHGFSMLVTVTFGDHRASLLLDTGITPDGMLHNMAALGIDLSVIRTIVLSHGHKDHVGGLLPLIDRLGSDVSVHAHPDAFLNRRVILPNGNVDRLPPVDRNALNAKGVNLVVQREPSLLLEEHILLTGEVERTTDFELGFPPQQAEIDSQWQPDPTTKDDQSLIINVRDKGLVVITGCSHAGIINILRYAEALTGIDIFYAVFGGFHLGGTLFEPRIPNTVAELESRVPQVIVPCHCTGWKATRAIEDALPWAFTLNSVGTKYLL